MEVGKVGAQPGIWSYSVRGLSDPSTSPPMNTSKASLTQLPPDAVERVTTEAQKEGVFAGLTSGLASGSRFMGFNRNKTLLCGVLSGVLAGYLFTQAFTDTALAQLRAEEVRIARQRQTEHGTPSFSDSPAQKDAEYDK
ncbi:hypothetical protein AX16_001421 [Volvariella volvacea WC 439]|nr:hypothetical protein AX16_001421 [Volvariella volvacea WC 439]